MRYADYIRIQQARIKMLSEEFQAKQQEIRPETKIAFETCCKDLAYLSCRAILEAQAKCQSLIFAATLAAEGRIYE